MPTIEGILLKRLAAFLELYSIDLTEGVIVAFSGGADSLSLLSLLKTLAPDAPLQALYVNHNLRSKQELEGEISLNRENCERLHVKLKIAEARKGELEALSRRRKCGVEEAGRYFRYQVLEREMKSLSYSYIATAHTLDDQKETLLMRMFQGSRLHFAQPIKIVDSYRIRPLCNTSRNEIEAYLEQKNLNWSTDSTNKSSIYLRSVIRHNLIPQIEAVFPRWENGLLRLSDELNQIERYLQKEAAALFNRTAEIDYAMDRVVLRLEVLERLDPVLIRRILFIAFDHLDLGKKVRLPDRSVDMIVEAVGCYKKRSRMDVVSSAVSFTEDCLIWEKASAPLGASYISLVYSEYTRLFDRFYLHREVLLPDEKGRVDQVWISDEAVRGTLIVRSAQDEDVIQLAGGTKKVSALFGEWKIPRQHRWKVPILCDDEGVLAVLGSMFTGRTRVAQRVISSPLAPMETTLYSVLIMEG
ncbi:MAG: tRNA lysidine(34) synthetase TilS [Sphaerochaetaceae bacterium]